MLDRAKAIVDARFAVVGIAERFDESLLAVRRELGWRRLTYVNANVSRRKIARSDVPAETIRMIEEQNWLDVELYRYAGERLDAARGPGFGAELERFQRANARYRPWGALTYTLPKRARGALGRG
jgi:hypothetical protein